MLKLETSKDFIFVISFLISTEFSVLTILRDNFEVHFFNCESFTKAEFSVKTLSS